MHYGLLHFNKVQSRRWNWIGHVLRMEDYRHCMAAMTWKPEGRRRVGRPKTTWRRTVEIERNSLGWRSWNEAKRVASDRMNWRECTAALWDTRPEEDTVHVDEMMMSFQQTWGKIFNWLKLTHLEEYFVHKEHCLLPDVWSCGSHLEKKFQLKHFFFK